MSGEMAPLTSEVKAEMEAIIETFNNGLPKKCAYIPRYSGRYLYLARTDYGSARLPICRLEWRGRKDNWDFAIYKHSNNKYDPDEWACPGLQYVDGTVEGAMQCGLEAFPL
ncbi:hypothetical protein [Acidithiobacillus ferriphilus]|uniref:hypothetical protein n=1 Tax=Acidithiobacillus ferriphilus TaxID=1689834 RepID=UPI002DB971BC|nr:hypothetical protein [Acidithiobacillus ferriphilus]MEB8534562.1 hypothetical protein [Acidithiobacillus ferriphilus]